MSARAIKVSIVLLLLSFPSFSFASVSISELFYSPQSKSWIEVYNDSDSAIDLTKYKILDAGAATNGHAISAVSGSNLEPHQYAIVAKDPTAISTSAVVFKSSLGAKVTGDTISLKDDSGTIIDTFTFTSSMGAAGDGNSLQKTTTGGWVAAVPTPGTTNATTATPTNQGNNTSSTTQTQTTTSSSNDTTTAQQNVVATISTHYSYVPLSDFDATRDLQISAGRPRMAAVGNPIEFVADTNQDNGSTRYEWSFGDGTTESNKTARHIYEYPGEYAVVLHATSPSASAIARTTVKIVNPDIFVVDANTQYVEVYNNGAEEMNLYGWELDQGINTFMFPEDTIILPKQSVRFASTLTRLAPQTFADVTLAQSVVPGTLRVVARAPTALERQRLLPHASIAVASAAAPKVAPVAIKKALPQTAAVVLATEATTTLATSTASRGEAVKVTKSWMDTLRHFFGLK